MTKRDFFVLVLFVSALIAGIMFVVVSSLEDDIEAIELEREIQIDQMQRIIDRQQQEIDSLKQRELTWENIRHWMEHYDVEHTDIAMRQIFLETGNLASEICKYNNNLFGMRHPAVRETVSLGSSRGHAYYHDWIDSIKDYSLWQKNMYDGREDYYSFLSSVGYAECESYIRKLRYIERNIDINDYNNV